MTKSSHRQRLRLAGTRQAGTLNPRPLRFSPYAWRKLLFLRDRGPTEVGGFGISNPGDLLLVEDIALVGQACSPVTVRFEDEAVADHFDAYVDKGYSVARIGRIWVHTHPGGSADPSGTDEETFARCFGRADWAIMFILARGGETYARMWLRSGPGGSLLLPVEIDFSLPFRGSEELTWEQEYALSVEEEYFLESSQDASHELAKSGGISGQTSRLDWDHDPFHFSEGLEVTRERF